jgi:hypothetical protein
MPVEIRFSVPILIGPKATQPAVQWVPGQYRGVKRPERAAYQPPPSNTEVANVVLSSVPVQACHCVNITCKSQLTIVLLVKRMANKL